METEIPWIIRSILSNSTEVHSFELGFQIALLVLLLRYYTSEQKAGVFLMVFLCILFTLSPIPEIIEKPWYFFSTLVATIGGVEMLYVFTRPHIYASSISNAILRRN